MNKNDKKNLTLYSDLGFMDISKYQNLSPGLESVNPKVKSKIVSVDESINPLSNPPHKILVEGKNSSISQKGSKNTITVSSSKQKPPIK